MRTEYVLGKYGDTSFSQMQFSRIHFFLPNKLGGMGGGNFWEKCIQEIVFGKASFYQFLEKLVCKKCV